MVYDVHLEIFEGPLELLLYLIRKDDLEIAEIPIAQITTEYLSYLEMMKDLNLDIAGEFLVMASTLMQIKARMLLPSDEADEDEGPNPLEELKTKLLEYQKFKEASRLLAQREETEAQAFTRNVEPVFDKDEYVLQVSLFDLLESFKNVLKELPSNVREIVYKEIPIEHKIRELLDILQERRFITFSEIFRRETNRHGLIVSFMALLELVRLKQIMAIQSHIFEDIRIYRFKDDGSGPDLEPGVELVRPEPVPEPVETKKPVLSDEEKTAAAAVKTYLKAKLSGALEQELRGDESAAGGESVDPSAVLDEPAPLSAGEEGEGVSPEGEDVSVGMADDTVAAVVAGEEPASQSSDGEGLPETPVVDTGGVRDDALSPGFIEGPVSSGAMIPYPSYALAATDPMRGEAAPVSGTPAEGAPVFIESPVFAGQAVEAAEAEDAGEISARTSEIPSRGEDVEPSDGWGPETAVTAGYDAGVGGMSRATALPEEPVQQNDDGSFFSAIPEPFAGGAAMPLPVQGDGSGGCDMPGAALEGDGTPQDCCLAPQEIPFEPTGSEDGGDTLLTAEGPSCAGECLSRGDDDTCDVHGREADQDCASPSEETLPLQDVRACGDDASGSCETAVVMPDAPAAAAASGADRVDDAAMPPVAPVEEAYASFSADAAEAGELLSDEAATAGEVVDGSAACDREADALVSQMPALTPPEDVKPDGEEEGSPFVSHDDGEAAGDCDRPVPVSPDAVLSADAGPADAAVETTPGRDPLEGDDGAEDENPGDAGVDAGGVPEPMAGVSAIAPDGGVSDGDGADTDRSFAPADDVAAEASPAAGPAPSGTEGMAAAGCSDGNEPGYRCPSADGHSDMSGEPEAVDREI